MAAEQATPADAVEPALPGHRRRPPSGDGAAGDSGGFPDSGGLPDPCDDLAHDPAAERQHADHEDQAGDDGHRFAQRAEPVHAREGCEQVAELADLVLQQHHHGRADQRAGQRAQATDERHQDHLARGRPVHVRQRGEAQYQRLERAGQPRDGGRDHEGQQLEALRVVAERDGARLVLLDALEHLAERRMDGAHDQQEGGDHHGQRHVVHRHVAGQVEHAEQLAARHALQAVFAARERCLQAGEEQHLRERQRDHREIDALAADGQPAEQQAQQRAAGRAEQQPDLGREPPDLDRMAGDIGRAPQEGRMAERQKPRVAQQQVEGRSEQCEAQQLHHEHGIGAEERRGDQAQQQQAIAESGEILVVHVRGPVLVTFPCRTGRRGG